jgi:Domain of unknown function (DUF222)
LAPKLEHTAAGQRAGTINTEHVKVIRGFFAQLPFFVDEPTRADAERKLAEVGAHYRPDELERVAAQLDLMLNPDGTFNDKDRARRRGITVGPQGDDGMSRLSGWLNPELRAGLDAVLAKWAAAGMCNPADNNPTVTDAPPQEAINADVRTTAQRNHDALNAGFQIWHCLISEPASGCGVVPAWGKSARSLECFCDLPGNSVFNPVIGVSTLFQQSSPTDHTPHRVLQQHFHRRTQVTSFEATRCRGLSR